MTETRPPAAEAGVPVEGGGADLAEARGLAGWLTTSDHRRIGRLFIGMAFVALVAGSVIGAIVAVERVDTGLALLDDGTFSQVYGLHGEVALFGFLLPLFLGLATAIVPLQVGAPDIAFPRASATAFWLHLVGLGVLVGAYAADGGPGGSEPTAVDLHLLALGLLSVATCIALVSVLTTILALRAPGMTLARTPLFSWSLLVGGGLTLLAVPVLVANLVEAYVASHFGGDPSGAGIGWFGAVPQVYVLAVPAAGVAAEIVPVVVRRPLRLHVAGLVVLGAMAVLGFGAFAQASATQDDFLHVAMNLAAVLPALALLGLLGDTVRRGSFALRAPLLLALGAVVMLLLGALAGATSVIDPLDLRGTVWESAQVHYTLYGGATLGAFAGLWWWAPKLWGVHLGEGAGRAVFALTFLGALLLAAPDLVNGLVQDQPLAAAEFDDESLTITMNVVSAIGAGLAVLGVLVAFGDVLGRVVRRRGRPAGNDPWGGHTLEWRPDGTPPPAVTTPTPLLSDAGPV